MKTETKPSSGTMSTSKFIGFGIGGVGTHMCFALMTSFAIYFFTDLLGISAAVAGSVVMIANLFSGVTDIGMGTLVDRTNSRYGKARPWMLCLSIPLGLSLIPLFSAPNFSMTGKIVWAFVVYNLVATVLYTGVNVPYMSMVSLLSENQEERSKLSMLKMSFALFTGTMVSAFTVQVVEFFGGGKQGWQITAGLGGAVAAVTLLTVFFSTKELPQPKRSKSEADAVHKGEWKALFQNKYLLLLVVTSIVFYLNISTVSATVYFGQYVLKDTATIPLLSLASMLPTAVFMLFLSPLVKRFGKRNVSLVGIMISVVGCIVTLLAPDKLPIVMAGLFLRGAGAAGFTAFLQAMIADAVTYGQWKFGKKVDGKAFGCLSFSMKFGSGAGAAMIGWILALGGYIASLPQQSDSTLVAIKGVYLALPLVCNLIVLALLSINSLDKIYPNILRELKARTNAVN